jgi:glucose/mannose transport system substrate-binding protein
MFKASRAALLCAALWGSSAAQAGPTAEVIHWWTSGGESAAVKQIAQAFRAAGGTWVDTAIAGGDQSRAVTINRMVGNQAPTAAQFNTSKQFLDLIEEGLLNNVDDIARREDWDHSLPEPVVSVIRKDGHYYAVPVNLHMQAWIWYSKAAFRKAGITHEPANLDELFAALDKLKKAGLVPLAHGGQSWQEIILFSSMLAHVGGRDLFLKALRDRDQATLLSPAFRQALLAYKRLQSYVDPGSPGRNWNDATAMVISGKAGMQIMGDWAKGEFSAAKQTAGVEYGCLPGLGPQALYLVQGDAFVFPKSRRQSADSIAAQKLLANAIVAPATQLAFNRLKGSIPIRSDVDVGQLDACARKGMEIVKDRSRVVGVTEIYLTPDQNGALQDVLTAFWNTSMPVERAQKSIASALKY